MYWRLFPETPVDVDWATCVDRGPGGRTQHQPPEVYDLPALTICVRLPQLTLSSQQGPGLGQAAKFSVTQNCINSVICSLDAPNTCCGSHTLLESVIPEPLQPGREKEPLQTACTAPAEGVEYPYKAAPLGVAEQQLGPVGQGKEESNVAELGQLLDSLLLSHQLGLGSAAKEGSQPATIGVKGNNQALASPAGSMALQASNVCLFQYLSLVPRHVHLPQSPV